MNKYNIRAIRKELDDCIRSGSWKQFRSRFTAVSNNAELCQAIIEYRQRKKSARSGGFDQSKHENLLHSLCSARTNPPVPVDIIQTISSAVPHVIHSRDSRGRTPLHIAIDREGRSDVIRCLLRMDTAKESLSVMDMNGDTPLLLAVRSSEYDHSDVVRLLVQYDTSKKSLLIKSKKKKRTPLWYVAADELSIANGVEVSEELQFMLLSTYKALRMARTPKAEQRHRYAQKNDTIFLHDDEDGENVSHGDSGVVLMLQAAIACYHILGKFASKLFEIILGNDLYRRVLLSSESDEHGNLFFHQLCMVTAKKYDRDISLDGDGSISLLDFFLMEQAPLILGQRNPCGALPLHLAIRSGKALCHIESLVNAYPHALRQPNECGELPLHIAIKQVADFGGMKVAWMLWKLYPEAAEVRDGRTRLYAFQLAACCEWGNAKDSGNSGTPADSAYRVDGNHEAPKGTDTKAVESEHITSIYTFLLESPQVLQQFV